MNKQELIKKYEKEVEYIYGPGKTVAVLDYGIKNNILENLKARGCNLKVYPYNTSAEEILKLAQSGYVLDGIVYDGNIDMSINNGNDYCVIEIKYNNKELDVTQEDKLDVGKVLNDLNKKEMEYKNRQSKGKKFKSFEMKVEDKDIDSKMLVEIEEMERELSYK